MGDRRPARVKCGSQVECGVVKRASERAMSGVEASCAERGCPEWCAVAFRSGGLRFAIYEFGIGGRVGEEEGGGESGARTRET